MPAIDQDAAHAVAPGGDPGVERLAPRGEVGGVARGLLVDGARAVHPHAAGVHVGLAAALDRTQHGVEEGGVDVGAAGVAGGGGVHDAAGGHGLAGHQVGVGEVAADGGRARGLDGRGGGVAAGQRAHGVPVGDQRREHRSSDETGTTGEEDVHAAAQAVARRDDSRTS
jgi:hypothetical protein